MKKMLVLGGYGNVGKVVVMDLITSGYEVGIAGRDSWKIDALIWEINSTNAKKEVIDIKNRESLKELFSRYDIVINCLDYSFNAIVLDLCIEVKKHYVDLWDSYEGIVSTRAKDGVLKEKGVTACLWAGSAPWIVNVFVKHIAKKKEKVETLTISFSDEIKNAPEKMLPFNFMTVVDEILGDALLFEDGKYAFVKGGSKKMNIDFCHGFESKECYLTNSFVTNHDEQFSLPIYLREKGIKNVYFVMKHTDNIINLVNTLNEFWFLDKKTINIKWVEISPFDFCDAIMKQYAPLNFKSDDKEALYVKLDDTVVAIINYSVNGIPAGVMNTGIGCSLIAQYLLEYPGTPGTVHPEDFVDDLWMIEELKKRNFEIYIDWEKI